MARCLEGQGFDEGDLKKIQSQQLDRFKLKNVRSPQLQHNGMLISKVSSTTTISPDFLGLETTTQLTSKNGMTLFEDHTNDSEDQIDQSVLIKALQLDNEALKSKLMVTESELQKLKLKKSEEKLKQPIVPGASASEKIIDLSKRNRELNATLSVEKSKVQQLSLKLKKAEDLHEIKDSEAKNVKSCEQDGDQKVKVLTQQLEQCNMKLTECRNENQIIKQELKMAHKIIVSEVGKVDTNLLLSGAVNWRGRAQQIIILQNKLKETKRQLAEVQKSKTCPTILPIHTVECSDITQKATLAKMEQEKKSKLYDTHVEMESLRKELLQMQQQCKALKARNKILTSDLKEARTSKRGISAESSRSHVQDQVNQKCLERDKVQLLKQNKMLEQQLMESKSKLHKLEAAQSLQATRNGNCPASSTSSNNASDTLLAVARLEKERLLQLSQSLQQRLDATTNKMMKLDTDLRIKKQQGKKSVMKYATEAKLKHSDPVPDEDNAEERLALLTNENMVLRETLELTRHEKLEDITLLTSMVQDAKKLFMDSIKK